MYFTNIAIAMNCMGNTDYEVDMVHHTVENMDHGVKTETGSNYTAHLKPRARNPLTQIRAVQDLLVAATKAEKPILSTKALISKQYNKVMLATVLGYTGIPVSDRAATLCLASVAKRTIAGNTAIPRFDWKPPMCV